MSSSVLILLALLATLISVLWYYISEKYKYWEKKNVPYLKPTWPFGTFKDRILLRKSRGFVCHDHCLKYPDAPYVGGYIGLHPILILNDPDYIKTVLVKKFPFICGRVNTDYVHQEILTQFVFFNGDDEWKVLRQNITPMYSSSKMKNMFHLIVEQTHAFEKMLKEEFEPKPPSDVTNVMVRYTMDCVASCAFGVNSNLMGQNSRSNPFSAINESIFKPSLLKSIGIFINLISPKMFYMLGLKIFRPWMYDFFDKLLNDVFEERSNKPSERNDFVDMIINLKKQSHLDGDSLSYGRTGERKTVTMEVNDNLLVSQCLGIFVAGFDTSATAMTYACYHIARNEHVQSLIHKEVDDYFTRHKGKLGYEILTELTYLDACLEETLRLTPIAPNVQREVLYDCILPDGLKLEKGVRILVPVLSIHHNEKYFPNPEDFKPERFIGEERKKIKPYTFLAFGEGPRICLGLRFSKMQTLAGLAILFKNYKLECVKETPEKLSFVKFGLILHPESKIYLKFVPRLKNAECVSNKL